MGNSNPEKNEGRNIIVVNARNGNMFERKRHPFPDCGKFVYAPVKPEFSDVQSGGVGIVAGDGARIKLGLYVQFLGDVVSEEKAESQFGLVNFDVAFGDIARVIGGAKHDAHFLVVQVTVKGLGAVQKLGICPEGQNEEQQED